MKKFSALLFAAVMAANIAFSQAPQSFSFQAVARDNAGNILPNQSTSFRISILSGTATGPVIYSETHAATTNTFGLVTLQIGKGTPVSGAFTDINWGNDTCFIKTELDPTGGTSYQFMGTSQLLSVPYALYANSTNTWTRKLDTLYSLPDSMMVIKAGKVGIGVDDPSEKLEVNGKIWSKLGGFKFPDNTIQTTAAAAMTETDPVFSAHPSHTITSGNISNWNTAYGWGNHATAGYLKTYTETDPVFGAHPAAGITAPMIGNWNTAYTNRITGASGTAPLTLSLSSNLLSGSITKATSTVNGYLSSADWNTFNNKVSSQWVTNGLDIYYSAGRVGVGTATPATSAALELSSTSRGFLPPRMTMAQRNAIATPANGLMICQTDNTPGYYYNSGSSTSPAWVLVGTGSGWSLTGNSGTSSTTNFIGTTDNVALTIKVNNEAAGKIDPLLHNTSLGYKSLSSNTTGINNTACGKSALDFNTTGASNTASGVFALGSNTTGSFNTANGKLALYSNTTGNFNTTSGHEALRSNTTGEANTATGNQSLLYNTTGHSNTAVGNGSLAYNTTGYYNTAVGDGSLLSNTTGYSNVAIGASALNYTTDRSNLVAIGDSALYNNGFGATGNEATGNTAIGSKALYANVTGSYSTAVGFNALYSNTTGTGNAAFGFGTLSNNGTGNYNTAYGFQALMANTGSGNTAIGAQALWMNSTGEENLAVGASALAENRVNSRSTAIGYYAMENADARLTNGILTYNTAIGYAALRGGGLSTLNTGQYNTAIGDQALWRNSSGNSNTAVGCSALKSNMTGNNNSALGYKADVVSAGLTNATAIGAFSQVGASNSLVLGSIAGVNGATVSANVGIGITAPNNSALLDLTSTSKGILVPRMTATQRTAIPTPADGLMVYDTDTSGYYYYHSGAWVLMHSDSTVRQTWTRNQDTLYSVPDGVVKVAKNDQPGVGWIGIGTTKDFQFPSSGFFWGNSLTFGPNTACINIQKGGSGDPPDNCGTLYLCGGLYPNWGNGAVISLLGNKSNYTLDDAYYRGSVLITAGWDPNFYNHTWGNVYIKTHGLERVRIDANGNVGINTDFVGGPSEKLEVNGLIFSSQGGIKFPDNTIQTTAATGNDTWIRNQDTLYSLPDSSVTVKAGNVGIGVEEPSEKLEVNGRIWSKTGGFKFPDNTIQITAAQVTDSNRIWLVGGNTFIDTTGKYLGTNSDHALEMRVHGNRALRLEPNANCPNIIGGYKYNKVTSGFYGGTISGGGFQYASGTDNYNEILNGNFGTVGGGIRNKVTAGDYSTVGGGYNNSTTGTGATVSGGKNNQSGFNYAAVCGGTGNKALGLANFVGGGENNQTQGDWSLVSGGGNNTGGGWASVIGGGAGNVSIGQCSTIPGGYFNTASGNYSFAGGFKAQALHKGAYVWSDSSSVSPFASTANNQYIIRAAGGVGINTNSPAQQLHVDNGNILVEGTGSFDAAAEQAILYLGNTSHFIKSEYGYGLKLGTASLADALTIKDPAGNVGIGTNDPVVKLDIKGLTNASTLLRINQTGTDNYTGTRLDRDDTEKWFIGMDPATQNLLFRRTATTNDIIIESTGNVGIGAPPSFTHRLTVYHAADDNVLRLMGPDGTYQYGARLNFGDGDLVYLDEDEDDKLTIFGNGRTAIMGGNVGIGTLAPGAKLAVYNGVTTGTYTTTGWMHSSDARLKSNIVPIDNALGKVLEMKGVYFNWKNDAEKRQVGFVAQDVEPVLPEVVSKDDEGSYSMSYGGVVPVLVEAIKELKLQNDELLPKLKELRQQNDELMKRLNELELKIASVEKKK